jgi:hypothetical protein
MKQLNSLDNCNFVAHIIRDTLNTSGQVCLYGDNFCLHQELKKPEHSIGSFMLHTESLLVPQSEDCQYWEIGVNNPYLAYRSVDLMLSISYNLSLTRPRSFSSAIQISNLLKIGARMVVINPGSWADSLDLVMQRNAFLEDEMKRFSLLKEEKVAVYENL